MNLILNVQNNNENDRFNEQFKEFFDTDQEKYMPLRHIV